ncbi:MAG TPA: hypothetical protein VGI86_03350, partial [Acidimicrobiia bacterium]
MTRWGIAHISALVVLATSAAACSSSNKALSTTTAHAAAGSSSTASTSTTSPLAATTTVGITPPSSVPPAQTSVPGGAPASCNNGTSSTAIYNAQNGYYATAPKTVDTAGGTLRYDVVQFLVGAEAKAAWLRDNPKDPDGPPNDYYVVNENPAIYTSPF